MYINILYTFGVENIAPTTSRASASPQNPDIEQIITNAPEILNTPPKKNK